MQKKEAKTRKGLKAAGLYILLNTAVLYILLYTPEFYIGKGSGGKNCRNLFPRFPTFCNSSVDCWTFFFTTI